VKGLPSGSAVHKALDPDAWSWTNTEELLATLIEVVDLSNRLFIAAHKDKKTPLPKPLIIPRPQMAPVQTKQAMSSPAELKKAAGKRIRYTPKEKQ
jgi:hypothetical protein